MGKVTASRYHDFSAGHRVYGHENKCSQLHGHNYRIHFHCESENENRLDSVGRVIDFGVIKEKLCMWLEDNWDHKFLICNDDPLKAQLIYAVNAPRSEDNGDAADSIVVLDFNPTAEMMALYLVTVIGPKQLKGTGVVLSKVVIEETAKCSAEYSL